MNTRYISKYRLYLLALTPAGEPLDPSEMCVEVQLNAEHVARNEFAAVRMAAAKVEVEWRSTLTPLGREIFPDDRLEVVRVEALLPGGSWSARRWMVPEKISVIPALECAADVLVSPMAWPA